MSVQTGREVAHRVFATEYNTAAHEVSDSDDERAPNYVIMPTGARVNRLFVVGVLTSVESVSDETLRARIADPTGTFVVYAGQYQPDERAALERIEPPAFVAVTGKANTFTPEGSDDVLTSIRPEAINEVDGDTRDRWVLSTAEHTRDRITRMARALQAQAEDQPPGAVLTESHAVGVEQALEAYETTAEYLAALDQCVTETIAVIAGEQSEATPVEVAPAERGTTPVTPASLIDEQPAVDTQTTATESASSAQDDHEATEPGTVSDSVDEEPATAQVDGDGPADFEPDVDEPFYEFNEDERAEIESEHGLEFTTGNEVSASDDDPPTADEPASPDDEDPEQPAEDDESVEQTTDEDTEESPTESDEPEEIDTVGAVLTALETHGDGDGVTRTTVIETVAAETGVSETAVKEAIEEALLSGRCYEPSEDRLKPI